MACLEFYFCAYKLVKQLLPYYKYLLELGKSRKVYFNALISFIAIKILFLFRKKILTTYAPPNIQNIKIEPIPTDSKARLAAKHITPAIANSIAKSINSLQSISFHIVVLSDFALISASTTVNITVTKTVAIAGPIKPKT